MTSGMLREWRRTMNGAQDAEKWKLAEYIQGIFGGVAAWFSMALISLALAYRVKSVLGIADPNAEMTLAGWALVSAAAAGFGAMIAGYKSARKGWLSGFGVSFICACIFTPLFLTSAISGRAPT